MSSKDSLIALLKKNIWGILFFVTLLICILISGFYLQTKREAKESIQSQNQTDLKFPILLFKGELFRVPDNLDTLWILSHTQYKNAIKIAKKYELTKEIESILQKKNNSLQEIIIQKDSLLSLYISGYLYYKNFWKATEQSINKNSDSELIEQVYQQILKDYEERNKRLETVLNWQKEYTEEFETQMVKKVSKAKEDLELKVADLEIQLKREKEYVDPDKVTVLTILQSLKFTHISAIVIFLVTVFGIGYKLSASISKSKH